MGIFKVIQDLKDIKKKNENAKEIVNLNMKASTLAYEKPILPKLSEEEIADIHSRGKITAAEMVREWESFDLCAPGDAIGSAAYRCRKFHHNCHDCLVDYASDKKEYTSMYDFFKVVNPYPIISDEDKIKVKQITNHK